MLHYIYNLPGVGSVLIGLLGLGVAGEAFLVAAGDFLLAGAFFGEPFLAMVSVKILHKLLHAHRVTI